MALPDSNDVVKRATTRAGALAYRIDGDGPPILLCQRFRGTIDDWDPAFVEALISAGRSVIRFDNVGIGRSSGETPPSIPAWADAALDFMAAVCPDPVDVLGWSIGGFVAQWIVLKAPDRVRRLIVAASGPGAVTEVPPDPKVAEIRTHAVNDEEDFLYLFFPQNEAGRTAGRAHLARIAAQSHGPDVSEASYKAQVDASKAYHSGPDAVRHRLAQLAVPTLVANGVGDVMQPAFASFVIAKDAPDAKLLIYPDSGHAFLFQHVDEFVADLSHFLRERS